MVLAISLGPRTVGGRGVRGDASSSPVVVRLITLGDEAAVADQFLRDSYMRNCPGVVTEVKPVDGCQASRSGE